MCNKFTYKVIVITLIVMMSLLSLSFGQTVTSKEIRKSEMESFNSRFDGTFLIRWDETTGTPKSITGDFITKYNGSALENANQFLYDEKKMLGFESIENSLQLNKTGLAIHGGTRAKYSQVYNGIKVLYSGCTISLDKNGNIYYMSGDFYPEISLKSTVPELSSQGILSFINDALSPQTVDKITESELCIFPDVSKDKEKYHLVYAVTVTISDSPEMWQFIIDANDGAVHRKIDLIESVNGTGSVYKTDPDDCSITNETLYGLYDTSPRYLRGDNAYVYNDDGAEAYSYSAYFVYAASNTHFDEVMAYYHGDMFKRFMVGLGIGTVGQVTIHTHNPTYYAATNSSGRVIYLSDGDGWSGLDNPAKDGGVITHEYMHVCSETYNSLTQNDEAEAMDESYSDYFGVAYYNQHSTTSVIGAFIDQSGGYVYQRDLDNSYTYSQFGEIDLEPNGYYEEHDNCVIFSGALWDFRTDGDTDEETVDEIILASIDALDGSPSFIDGREACISEAVAIGESGYRDDIALAFYAHGIGNGAPSVTISGPGYLAFKASAICTANVSGGNSPISYQWYKKIGQGSWISLGTSSTQSITMGMDDITMKVVVTDYFDLTDEDTHLIETGIFKLAAGEEATLSIPDKHTVAQNYPNPFNPETQIRFGLPEDSKVTIEVFNLQGQKVATIANGYYEAGYHSVTFRGANHPSGIYFYKIVAGEFTDVKRMLLIK